MNTNIPAQEKGSATDTTAVVTAATHEEANRIYERAVQRLTNVNQWQSITNASLSAFQLTDEDGQYLQRGAQEKDYIRIDIPAPGTQAGEGYDWVIVEDIGIDTENEHAFGMRVRPVSSPINKESSVAHFFKPEATSTFKVVKLGLTVTAGVYGRNEIPNTKNTSVVDAIRNTIVASGAAAGGSRLQWQELVNAWLNV